MAGRGVAVYTDELVYSALAAELRRRGYDAVSCHEAGRANQKIGDPAQLAHATGQGRAILTNNNRDFVPLAVRWKRQGREHAGMMLYTGFPPVGELLRRVIAHLDSTEPETQRDTVLWLPL